MCPSVRAIINGTPMERGRPSRSFYTWGSPIALWSLRFPRFGEPVRFPSAALAIPPRSGTRLINCTTRRP